MDQEERALQAVQVRLGTEIRRDSWIVLILVTSRSKHVILFVLPAKYGYEGILGHVYQVSTLACSQSVKPVPDLLPSIQKSRHSWRVHVSSAKFSEYLCNSELAQCTDEDPAAAQVAGNTGIMGQ